MTSEWTFAALSIPLGLVLAALSGGGRGAVVEARRGPTPGEGAQAVALAAALDARIEATWTPDDVPAPEVDALTFARRVWLDLLGTIPSLEELREVEALAARRPDDPAATRAALVERALADPRFPPALAERLARIAVGAEARPDDLLYRRRRLVAWLTAQVRAGGRWDALVRELIRAEGLSTDQPAVNFVISQRADPLDLAGRSARAFLGVRLDCARCHDHPFARWKQEEFQGLAAYFARVERDLAGLRERPAGELVLDASGVLAPRRQATQAGDREVRPAVPFAPEALPADAPNRRAALAAWITHPDNPYFAKAIVNRLWGWLIGRALVEPPDELDTTAPRDRELLDLLARDLVAHGYDLARTIRAIVLTRAYARDSRAPDGVDEEQAVERWLCAPLEPLRADQLAAAILQTTSLTPLDRDPSWLLRLARNDALRKFVRRRGDDLSAELPERETLLQRLQLMNGGLVREVTKSDDAFRAIPRLPLLASSDALAVEGAFRVALARAPSPTERAHFSARLAAAGEAARTARRDENAARAAAMSDLFWSLVNTTEFAHTR